MSVIVDTLKKGLKLLEHGDDDFFDRLSSRFTVTICIVFAVFVTTAQFAGEPIDCWTPAEFNGQWVKYTNKVCWVQNTYFVPFDESLPGPDEIKYYDTEISYYQWTNLILILQAFCFAFPSICWSFSTHYAGYGLRRIVHQCNKAENDNPESRDKLIKNISNQMDRLLGYRREYREGWLANVRKKAAKRINISLGKRYGCHLVMIYLFIKLVFIGNILLQIYLINLIIGEGYASGYNILIKGLQGEEWQESPYFPRITQCYFKIRTLGNIHPYVVQCVLPINLLNEKIYIFLWWWCCLIGILTVIGLIAYLPIFFPFSNRRYVSKYLKIMGRNKPDEKKYCHAFVVNYLRQDGILALWLISRNVTDLTIGELVAALYDNFVAYKSKIFVSEHKSSRPSFALERDGERHLLA